jgi:uncharacterized SAM-binding protein YcdF (DUF218 family)
VEQIWLLQAANLRDFQPAYLVVLAGGWRPGETPEEDYLGVETQRRVLHAAALWRQYPESKLVLSGWSGSFGAFRHPARQVDLMAEVAHRQGVPTTSMVLEPRAVSTFDHPNEVLNLAGFTARTPVGIVTSGWHMRRAYSEFCKHFERVAPYPVAPSQYIQNWTSFTPSAGALRDSSTIFHEFVGMVWYRVRDTIHGGLSGSKCQPLRNDGPKPGRA